MKKLTRFSISLEQDLLNKFDNLIKQEKYSNRSEAFRDLIRDKLVKSDWHKGKKVAGAITLIYDHHRRELIHKLMEIQHDFQELVVSTQHIHLDHHNCFEIIAVKGNARDVKKLSDSLKSVKGVKHAALSMSSTGKDI